ncbi:MAG TPA: hypothetical protein VNE39_06080 [Planctomycetota bacterium]|nr:hypothetical protein [Planctomycetota bacterium]
MRGLPALLAFSVLGCMAGTPVEMRPYVDPSQLDVPWPKHSHVKQPWRGFLETRPAAELLDGIGMVYQYHGGSMEAQLGLLAKAGIRCLRWEQPFGTYDPDIKGIAKHSEQRYREMLGVCKKLGIVPIILLNAHHGYPCKMKHFERRLAADAPKGSAELLLDSVEGFRVLYSGTNGLTDYWAGQVLFTEIEKDRKAVKLSKPLPKDLKKGEKLNCMDFYYLPFHPVGTPEFEHTAGGWVDYARAVCQVAKEEGIAIELELWNELSFGSHFAGGGGINDYWPGRAKFTKDFLRPGGHAWEVSRRTIEMAKKEFPGTRCIWGWSNTTFFHCPIKELPPGTDGQSYHPYGTGWRDLPEREQDPKNPARCLEAFCPTYRLCFAEGWAHTAIQCESLMHHLRPDKRLTVKPQGVERFHHYITEHGVVPAEAGVKGEAESLRLKEKFLLRALLFWLNKGLSRMTLFVSGPDKNEQGMGFHLAKVKELKAMPPDGEVDEWLSPALRSLRRAVKAFEGAVPIPTPRQFDVQFAKLGPDRKVFEMPEGKPTLWFSDLFAVLPFQVTEKKFVIALYEMTPNYNVEEMKDTPYRLTLRPVKGKDCKLAYYDPLADKMLPAKVVQRGEDALTLELPIIDTPRLLTLEERD